MARILVVDDSFEMRIVLRETLEKLGHEVVALAANGKMAYYEYKKHLPDVITMDAIMPDISGVKAAEEIIKEYPEAKIVMISATAQSEMIFDALNNKIIKYYLFKPVSKEKLDKAIEEALAIL